MMFQLKNCLVSRNVYSAKQLIFKCQIHQSEFFSNSHKTQDEISKPLTENQKIIPMANYINKNPRNLERLNIARVDRGWGEGRESCPAANFPSRAFYHRVHMEKTGKYVLLYLQHYTGEIILEASTREFLIRKHLYSGNDVAACSNVARVLAERCLRAGIFCVHWPEEKKSSESVRVAREAMIGCGMTLTEATQREFHYRKPHWIKKGPTPFHVDNIKEL